ncbi:MAG: response regulator [Candidatus Heimdallarchaeota archaeon]
MLKILIAEDDPHIRNLFKKILKNKGYDTIEARDGEQALEIYDTLSEKPDIIVLDFRMPKINGLEVIKEILNRDPESNILMISGDPCINQLDLTNSHIRFKEKPVKMDDFLSEINSIVAQV